MISIEDVTDAESEQQKPDHAHAGEAAGDYGQKAASAVVSPQTDANAEGEEQQVSSSEQDTLVGCIATGHSCRLQPCWYCYALRFCFGCVQKLVAEAEKCKEGGNALYKQKEYEAAAVCFGEAIVSTATQHHWHKRPCSAGHVRRRSVACSRRAENTSGTVCQQSSLPLGTAALSRSSQRLFKCN